MIRPPVSPFAEIEDLSYRYPGADHGALQHEDWHIEAGSFSLVVGPSGSGKSSLLRCLNGLVPHFAGGSFGGSVTIDGVDTRSVGPHDLGNLVGFVFQDPESQLVTDRVDDEIAFGLEQHGVDRVTMRKRVEESLDYLGIESLRHRRPSELSGGERQRVAVAAALAMHPRLLVLDEPTSQLDPWSAEEVLAVLTRLNDDLGLTVVVAEHRLERLLARADVVRVMGRPDGMTLVGAPEEVVPDMDPTPLPPVTKLGRLLGTTPPPLTIKHARQAFHNIALGAILPEADVSTGNTVVRLSGVNVRLGTRIVLRDFSLDVREGELVALMGRNGSGKTTLVRTIAGLQPVTAGAVSTCGLDMRTSSPADLAGNVGYVPQQASTLFFRERLVDELAFTARARPSARSATDVLAQFDLARHAQSHPLDLSGGERERAALATVLMGNPRVLLLDEPTRGMDAWKKADLAATLTDLRSQGVAIVMVTHDVELVAHCATRVVMLGDGEVVADGSPRDVLSGSLTYTTQINKVFGGRWLTVEDVTQALG